MAHDTTAHESLAAETEAARELTRNIASIAALPFDVLPPGPARDALYALAEAGHDVDVYRPMAIDRYVIWVRPEHPWQDGRYSPQEWQDAYADMLAFMQGKEVAE